MSCFFKGSYIKIEIILTNQSTTLFLQINHRDYANDKVLSELRSSRNYTYEDEITCSEKCLENYEEKVMIKSKRQDLILIR